MLAMSDSIVKRVTVGIDRKTVRILQQLDEMDNGVCETVSLPFRRVGDNDFGGGAQEKREQQTSEILPLLRPTTRPRVII